MRVLLFVCAIGLSLAARRQVGPQLRSQLSTEELDRIQKLWAQYGPKYGAYQKTDVPYPCGPLSKSTAVPTSVHALRPGDIKVVGALGDSLTAGTGIEADNIFGLLTQDRGLSWSGGGETNYDDQITVPNILKKYNPDVYGYAVGDGDENSGGSRLNVAKSGSESNDLVNQAQKLIQRMKEDPNVDFNNDWKVITILSGNNDLCESCNSPDDFNPQKFYEYTVAALDILHAEVPRALINLVEPLNMEMVTNLNKGLLCSALHLFGCSCAAYPDDDEAEKQLIREADAFQLMVEEIGLSGRYDTREDFTVVYQPFFNGTYLPRTGDNEPDMSYFAPDCFHLSRKGQAAAASALWNNMIEPISGKRTSWTPGEPIECPSEAQPFIFTNKNSNQFHEGTDHIGKQSYGSQQQGAQLLRGKADDTSSSISNSSTAVLIAGVALAVVVVAVVIGVVIRRRFRRRAYDDLST